MNSLLKKEFFKAKQDCLRKGVMLKCMETKSESVVILYTGKKEKAILFGFITDEEENLSLAAFKINIKKFAWAESEGFTHDQMINDFKSEIFKNIPVKNIANYFLI